MIIKTGESNDSKIARLVILPGSTLLIVVKKKRKRRNGNFIES